GLGRRGGQGAARDDAERPPRAQRLPRRGPGPGPPRGGRMTQAGAGTEVRSVLKIRDLVAGYGGGDVLRGVSLDVAEGGITCVVGPDGAGETQLTASGHGPAGAAPG